MANLIKCIYFLPCLKLLNTKDWSIQQKSLYCNFRSTLTNFTSFHTHEVLIKTPLLNISNSHRGTQHLFATSYSVIINNIHTWSYQGITRVCKS